MPVPSSCPDPQHLQDFLLGNLASVESTGLALHLESCDACLAIAQLLQAEDPLIEVMRQAANLAEQPLSEPVAALVQRLEEVLQTPKGEKPPDTPNYSTLDPQYPTESDLLPGASVPPEKPGELAATTSQDDPFGTQDQFLAPDDADALPTVPGYEILKELGRGGMGVVYQARQIDLHRLVALKMIRAGSGASPGELRRFSVEAKAVARLNHPNIVQIFDCGEHLGLPYFSLEYVAGGSLAFRFRHQLPPPLEAARMVEQLARGMDYAHDQNILHRDLKPENILLAGEEPAPPTVVKIADFGLAKQIQGDSGLTHMDLAIGTPSYMAPEQARGQKSGPPTDVYGLGAILYWLLTGRPPFKGANVPDTLDQVKNNEPVAPSQLQPKVPRDLQTICLECLQKDQKKRYATAKALAEDLRRFLNGEPILRRPPTPWERLGKWAWRKPVAAALYVVSLLAVFALVAVLALYALYQQQQAAISRQELKKFEDQEAMRRGLDEDLLHAREPEIAGNWTAANTELEKIQAALAAQPDLRADQLRNEVQQRLIVVRQKLQEQERQRETKKRGQNFQPHYDDGKFYYLLFTGLTPAENLAKTQSAAQTALGIYALTKDGGADQPTLLERDRDHLSQDEYTRLVGACYELLLIWAETVAAARPDPVGATEALALLDRAARLGKANKLDSRTYHLHHARFLAQSKGEKYDSAAAEMAAPQPQGRLDWSLTSLERYRKNDFAGAIVACGEVLRLQNDDFWAHYVKALSQLRLGQWPRAHSELTVCLNLKEDFVWPRLLRGFAASEEGFKLTQSAVKAGKEGRKARMADDQKLAATDYGEAEKDFNDALKVPDPLVQYVGLANRGVLNIRRGLLPEAVKDLLAAIEVNPNGLEGYLNLAQAYQEMKNWDAAVAALDQAIQRAPTRVILYENRARLHLAREDWTAAREDFQQAIQLEPEDRKSSERLVDNLVELGRLWHRQQEYQKALDCYDRALELQPKFVLAQRYRAVTLLALNRIPEAGRALDDYLAVTKPAPVRVYQARGLIYADENKLSSALGMYTLALVQNPKDTATLGYRGWAYLLTGAVRLGLDDFEACLREDKTNTDAFIGRGSARIRLGKLDDALGDARTAETQVKAKKGEFTGRQLYFLAQIHGLAANQLELKARTSKPGKFQPLAQELARCKTKALDYLELALGKQEKLADFWRDQVHTDPAFATIRGERRYSQLATRFPKKKEK